MISLPKSKDKLVRYILAKIENYLSRQKQRGGAAKRIDPDMRSITLEHILPQSQTNYTNWKHDFRSGADPAEYIYRLGNMTLLMASENKDAGNHSFVDKKKLIFDQSAHHIDEYIQNARKWGDQEIEERQQMLAKYAVDIWKL
jgi:hypothetical protein